MKEEGFLNKAFSLVKDETIEVRWLANQSGFNVSDDSQATITQRACIAFAVAAITKAADPKYGPDENLVQEAWNSKTMGALKAVINKVPT